MMSKTIFFLVKVFDKESYAEDFIKGKLYANRLSFFKGIEEAESANRGDRHEGVVSWLQPAQISLEINGRTLTDLAGPVSVQMNSLDNLNVFCLYAAHSGDFRELTEGNQAAFKKHLEIPNECRKLGEHAVVVTSVSTFFQRVDSAAKTNNFGLRRGLVEYYDPVEFHGSFSEADSVFRKQNQYEHQKEYRFSFDSGFDGVNPLTVDIGDISDITMRLKVSEINELLEIKLAES